MLARLIWSVYGCLAIASTALATPIQWTVASGGNGHYYDYVPGYLTWTQANAAADSLSYDGLPGHLATITTQAESDFIYDNFAPEQAWLGGYQDRNAPDYSEPAGGWRWVTGEPWNFTMWYPGPPQEPDNDGGDQDYLKYAAGPYWDDLQNDPGTGSTGINGFLVEYEPAVPEPACTALIGVAGAFLCRRRCMHK